MEKHEVWLCIGGNLGERLSNLEETRTFIEFNIGDILTSSGVYESPGWGMENVPPFLNQVLHVQTNLSIENLFEEIDELESFYGKTKSKGIYLSREMDVDVLFFDSMVLENEAISIPHPRLHLRKFVLQPLSEIAPELLHPVLKKKISELLLSCTDLSPVTKIA